MTNKKLCSDRERRLMDMARNFEMAKAEGKHIYLDAEDFADLAEWYARHNYFAEAEEVIQYALRLHPGNTSLLIEQVYEHLDREDREGAGKILRQIEEESDEVTILRARMLLEYNRLNDAELELDTLECKYSRDNIIDVAYIFLETGYTEKAGEWLAHWQWDTDSLEYCAAMTDYCMDKGDYEQAIILFNKLIDMNPYSSASWYGLGRCYFALKQYDKTIEACDYALVPNDEFGDAYLLKGYAYTMLQNLQKAQENYEKAVQYNSISGSFMHILLGINKLETCEWVEAYEHLDKVIHFEQEESNSIGIHSSLYTDAALCLKNVSIKDFSVLICKYCDKALQLDRFNLDAYLLKGLTCIFLGEETQGISLWEEAALLIPGTDTWMSISYSALEAGLFDYSLKALLKVKETEPTHLNLNERLTLTYILLKNKEKASHYNELSRKPLPQNTMNEIFQALKDYSKEDCVRLLRDYLKDFGEAYNPVV